MGINKPIIDAGPVSNRKDNYQVYIKEVNMPPPEPYVALREDGSPGIIQQPADVLGKMVHFRAFPTGFDTKTRMYVVVSVDGVLKWRPVVHEAVDIDPTTGQQWDPGITLNP